MIDPFVEYHVTRAGYVEERLRPVPAAVTLVLLTVFCWALILTVVLL